VRPDEATNTDFQISVIPEDISGDEQPSASAADADPGLSLESYRIKRLEHKLKELKQSNRERKQLHRLRKRHAHRLFWVAVAWIGLVWMIVLLQGFKGWFFPIPQFLEWARLPFNLSNTVIVAFMTSTTTTVLGLYGIAAYWLYKAKKEEFPNAAKESASKSRKPKESDSEQADQESND
jgi:hypothetical protein